LRSSFESAKIDISTEDRHLKRGALSTEWILQGLKLFKRPEKLFNFIFNDPYGLRPFWIH